MSTPPYDKFMHAGAPESPYEVANGARAAFSTDEAYNENTIGDQLQAYVQAIKLLSGTANRVILTAPAPGEINISGPQDLATTSSPTFANGTFTGRLRGFGVTDASEAAAGELGEFQRFPAAAPGVSVLSGVTTNIVSGSLPAGDWDVQFIANLIPGSSWVQVMMVGTSLLSASLPNEEFISSALPDTGSGTLSNLRLVSPTRRLLISAPTTVYGVVFANMNAAPVDWTCAGYLRARRAGR